MNNFTYLLNYVDKEQYPQLYLVIDLGVQAEKYLFVDTNVALFKLRQLNESFVKLIAQKNDISLEQYDETKERVIELSVAALIHQITSKLNISNYTRELFYKILEVGNEAVHDPLYNDIDVAQHRLQDAYNIVCVFFVWHYAPRDFVQRAFVTPELPTSAPASEQPAPTLTPTSAATQAPTKSVDEQKANDWVQQGNQFRKLRNYYKARECYENAIQENPNHGFAIYQLGMLYKNSREDGGRDKAETFFEKAVGLNYGFAYAPLAEMLLDKNDGLLAERVFDLLNRSLSFDKPNNLTYVLLSKIYEKGLLGTPKDLPKALEYAIQAHEAKYPNMEAKIARLERLVQEQPAAQTSSKTDNVDNITMDTPAQASAVPISIKTINARLAALKALYQECYGKSLAVKRLDEHWLQQADLSDSSALSELLALTEKVSFNKMSVVAIYEFVKQINGLVERCHRLLGQKMSDAKPSAEQKVSSQMANEPCQQAKQCYQAKEYAKVIELVKPIKDKVSDEIRLLLAQSYFEWGRIHHHGYGVEQDLSRALQCYQDSQLPEAQIAIKELIDQYFDTPEVKRFLANYRA